MVDDPGDNSSTVISTAPLPQTCEPPGPHTESVVWLIFGATSYLGYNLARVITSHGDKATVIGWSSFNTLQDLPSIQDHTLPALCDVRDAASVQGVVEASLEKWGRIDVVANLITSTTMKQPSPLELVSTSILQYTLDTILSGTLNIMTATLPHLRKASPTANHGGRYLILSSPVDLPLPGLGHACAARAALESWAETFALEEAVRYREKENQKDKETKSRRSKTKDKDKDKGKGKDKDREKSSEAIIEGDVKITLITTSPLRHDGQQSPSLMNISKSGRTPSVTSSTILPIANPYSSASAQYSAPSNPSIQPANTNAANTNTNKNANANTSTDTTTNIISNPSSNTNPAFHATRMAPFLFANPHSELVANGFISTIRVAETIWAIGRCGYPPLRIALGRYAVESGRDRLKGIIEEVEEWRGLSHGMIGEMEEVNVDAVDGCPRS